MTNTVRNPDWRIIETLAGLAGHHYRTWSYPTQEKILELLKRFTGRVMSRRTLNRHLKALQDGGWLRRIRRHVHDRKRGFVLRSTCYVIAGRYAARIVRVIKAAWRTSQSPAKSTAAIHVPQVAQYRRLL